MIGTAKHTPGPWSVFFDPDTATSPGIEAEDAVVSIVLFGDEGGDAGVRGATPEEAMANARLIAAAPELLEQLIVLRNRLRTILVTDKTGLALLSEIVRADEVLAFATGSGSSNPQSEIPNPQSKGGTR